MPEYRAAAQDAEATPDYYAWHRLLADAEADAESALAEAISYDAVWIERRVPPVDPPVERIKTLRAHSAPLNQTGGPDR